MTETNNVVKRDVGAGLAIGIFLIPWVFSWFTLRKGHSALSRVLSFGWGFAILLFQISIISAAASTTNSADSSPVITNETTESAIAINASDLIDEFKNNEVKATSKYKGKMLLVTGNVTNISSDMFDKPVVTLGGDILGASANGLPTNYVENLNKGNAITVLCKCGGEVIGMPMLNNCQPK